MAAKKSVLITGCSAGGMGEALALEHHSRGYRVFATSRTLASMESLAAQGIETLALDVTLSESIREVKEEISKRTGGQLHFLVNNAGAAGPIPVTDIDMSSARKMYDVNVFGVIEVTHAFIPLLVATKDACIVNIASLAAVVPFPFNSVYASTKGALISFGDTIRLELAPFGVKVVSVLPGLTRTNMTSGPPSSFLPENSIYKPVESEYERLRIERTKDAMPVADFAKNVASEVIKPNPKPHLWAGANTGLVWFMTSFLPWQLMDKLISDRTGLSKMKEFIRRGEVKVPSP